MSRAHQPLRVVIDVSSVPYGRGVSRYTSNLVHELAARPDIDLTLFGVGWSNWDHLREWTTQFSAHTKLVKLPPQLWHFLWGKLHFPPLTLLFPQAQVFHLWEWEEPPVGSIPLVVTIHDLAYRLYPETTHPQVQERLDGVLRMLEQNPSVKIIAVSDSTKADIINLTSIDPSRITVIPEALPEEAKRVPSSTEVQEVIEKLQLPKHYFFAVGTTEPRKNLNRVVQAWKENHPEDEELLIAGARGWDELTDVPGVRLLGYVSDTELAVLYRKAQALVYPSLYEGFGLPVLEAFFHDCLVITSRVSSLPEVSGQAAFLVDPYNEQEITQAMREVRSLSSNDRMRRVELGRRQLSKFDWADAAEKTLEVYRKAVK